MPGKFARFCRFTACFLLAGSGFVWLSACERAPETAAAPPPPAPSPSQEAEIERNVRLRLAAQDRIIEQQLANRRAAADLRGVGVLIQERLQREMQARGGQNGLPAASPAQP